MKQIPFELSDVLESSPETLSGAIRFKGTRVFVHQLFDYVLNGRPLEEFLADFEGVTKEQAEAVMKWELEQLHVQFEPPLSA